MVSNATFNNISVISWRSVLLVEETGVPGENHWPVANHWHTLSHNVVLSLLFYMWLWHGNLYRVSPFQVYCTSTSCLPCDLEFFMFAVIKTFVTDISASTGRNDFILDIWLLHGELYHVSPFQVYRISTFCLPHDLEFFMFAVIKTFVTDISASTGRNDFIFDIWLLHGDLYRVSPFQVYRTSTSCLPHS